MSSNSLSDQPHRVITSSTINELNSNYIDTDTPKYYQQSTPNSKSASSNINNKYLKKGSVVDDMDKLKQRREERKKKYDDDKRLKNEKNMMINDGVVKIDSDYENLIKKHKNILNKVIIDNHVTSENSKIFVCVRKRPIFKKETNSGEIDCVSSVNPRLFVHECKMKIDGITKYIEDHEFLFDNVFGDEDSTENVYNFSVEPTINLILKGGIVTCFAYGQTGSGKTYTMKGIQNLAIESLFQMNEKYNKNFDFYVSFFEIYAGRLYDLLNNKNKLSVLEDKNQKVQIFGLEEKVVYSAEEMGNIIDLANSIRTTHNTVTNETSSRSHAVCNIIIKEQGSDEAFGKLILVDLAGSERAQETQSNDKNRRAEGAEINKSLLALKECIRALDSRKNGNSEVHVPFRASKLTLVLRDSFIPKLDRAKIIMIACVSPGISSANHTINTLRYSDRLKEKSSNMKLGDINNLNLDVFKKPHDAVISKYDECEVEDCMQKLDLNPTPIVKHNIKNVNDQKNTKAIAPKVNKSYLKKKSSPDDWEYLNKYQDSKEEINEYVNSDNMISDDFIKFNDISEQIQNDEENIIDTHMKIIKENAKMLTKEGELISNIKGVGSENFHMEEYSKSLEQIINKKISLYVGLKKNIEIYKNHLKEGDKLKKYNKANLYI